MANMSHQIYEKFKEIKERHRQQQKIQKALEKEKADKRPISAFKVLIRAL